MNIRIHENQIIFFLFFLLGKCYVQNVSNNTILCHEVIMNTKVIFCFGINSCLLAIRFSSFLLYFCMISIYIIHMINEGKSFHLLIFCMFLHSRKTGIEKNTHMHRNTFISKAFLNWQHIFWLMSRAFLL